MTFKLIHLADLGLKSHPYGGINSATGLNKRFEDINRTLMFIVNRSIKFGCKYVIFAGDMNEERNPDSLLIQALSRQIKKLLDNNIRVIIVAGNHDLDGSIGTATSVSHLKELGLNNLYIADTDNERFCFDDDDIEFHCYPYLVRQMKGFEDNIKLSRYVNDSILNAEFKKKKNVLVAHYSTEKTFEGLQVDEVKLEMDVMKRYDYVALGHIHKYEMFTKLGINGGYSGSIYKKDFGENYDKFVNLLTVNDKKIEFDKIKLPVREFIEFDIDATDCEHDEFYNFVYSNLSGKIKNAIVKLRIKVNSRFNPKPIYDFLRKENVFHFVPIIWDKARKDRSMKIKNIGTLNDVEIIEKRLDDISTFDKDFKAKALVFCKDIVDEYHKTAT